MNKLGAALAVAVIASGCGGEKSAEVQDPGPKIKALSESQLEIAETIIPEDFNLQGPNGVDLLGGFAAGLSTECLHIDPSKVQLRLPEDLSREEESEVLRAYVAGMLAAQDTTSFDCSAWIAEFSQTTN